MKTTHIGKYPPEDGQEWDCQCARCGSSMMWEDCSTCGGEGVSGHECGEDTCCCRYLEDNVPCGICDGDGGWYLCISSVDWCEHHPIPGHEQWKRHEVEWFVVPRITRQV